MYIIKVDSYETLSHSATEIFIDVLNGKNYPIFGLATGSTPEGLYKNLIHESQS